MNLTLYLDLLKIFIFFPLIFPMKWHKDTVVLIPTKKQTHKKDTFISSKRFFISNSIEFIRNLIQNDLKNKWYIWGCCQIQVHVPEVQWSLTNQNVGVWRRERFIEEPCTKNGWLEAKREELPDGFQGRNYYRQNLGEKLQGV